MASWKGSAKNIDGAYNRNVSPILNYKWDVVDGSMELQITARGWGRGSVLDARKGPVTMTLSHNGSYIVYNTTVVTKGSVVDLTGKPDLTYRINWTSGWFPIESSFLLGVKITSPYGTSATWNARLEGPDLPVGKPSGRTSVTNITQTTADRSAIVGSWGTNASAGTWTWTYGPGNYNYSSGGATNTTLRNLTPGTTYNYKFWIKNGQGKTTTYTDTFRTKDYTPPSASISLNSVTNNSITFNYSTWNADIDRFNVFLNGNFYQTIWTTASGGVFTIGGLAPKTTYGVSIQPHTPYGDLWGGQTGQAYGTTYPNPVSINTNNTYMIEVLPFSARVAVTSSNAGDTDSYGYTLLNANKSALTGEARSGSSTYNFTGLTPETTYYARVRVFTKVSGAASAYYDIKFTTPPDQATVFIKVNNIWRRGKVFLKTSNTWIKSKYIYTKVQGAWRKNNNF